MDPLSDVLSLLKPCSYACGGFAVGTALSVAFPRYEGIKCYALVSGECWLVVKGVAEAVHLTAGDCVLLPRGLPFCLTTDRALTPVDGLALFPAIRQTGRIVPVDGGGDRVIVFGHFGLSGRDASALLRSLPAVVHLRNESDKAAMRWSLDRLMLELRDPQPGSFLIAQHLVYLMLVQALRLHFAEGLTGRVGLLYAVADPQVGAALEAMHDQPAHRWTLHALAHRAGMSRSAFALRFKETVGTSPLEYLVRWRMLLAEEKLAATSESIAAIATSLGYESVSAFSTAFKRVMGCSPREHGRRRASAASGRTRPGGTDLTVGSSGLQSIAPGAASNRAPAVGDADGA